MLICINQIDRNDSIKKIDLLVIYIAAYYMDKVIVKETDDI